jgi:hypothetical protein
MSWNDNVWPHPPTCFQLSVFSIGSTVKMRIYQKFLRQCDLLCFAQLIGQRGIRDRDEIATAVVCGPAAASATVLVLLLSSS